MLLSWVLLSSQNGLSAQPDNGLSDSDCRRPWVAPGFDPSSVDSIEFPTGYLPVDLSPHELPPYPLQAREAGFEGTIILLIVIAQTGDVNFVRVMSVRQRSPKKSEFDLRCSAVGIEDGTVLHYSRKKFKPARDAAGTPIQVKMFHPIRFALK